MSESQTLVSYGLEDTNVRQGLRIARQARRQQSESSNLEGRQQHLSRLWSSVPTPSTRVLFILPTEVLRRRG